VDELKEAEIDGQLLLRDAAMWAQPGAQQRPEAFQGVDVDLAEPIAIIIAGILAGAVADGLVAIAPGVQAGIDVVLIGVDQRAAADRPLDDRPDRGLLGSMWSTTSPPRWIRIGGFSFSRVPRPRSPFSRRLRPSRPFFERRPGCLCGPLPRRPRRSPPHHRAAPRVGAQPSPDEAVRPWPGRRSR
jgi:hypothetical protein